MAPAAPRCALSPARFEPIALLGDKGLDLRDLRMVFSFKPEGVFLGSNKVFYKDTLILEMYFEGVDSSSVIANTLYSGGSLAQGLRDKGLGSTLYAVSGYLLHRGHQLRLRSNLANSKLLSVPAKIVWERFGKMGLSQLRYDLGDLFYSFHFESLESAQTRGIEAFIEAHVEIN